MNLDDIRLLIMIKQNYVYSEVSEGRKPSIRRWHLCQSLNEVKEAVSFRKGQMQCRGKEFGVIVS